MPSKIEWTDETWPVVTGCSHAGGPGCDNCYAARMAATRLRRHPRYEGLATIKDGQAKWTGKVRLNHDVLDQPLRWRKPRRVFVASMGDLFHEGVPFEFIDLVFLTMTACNGLHTFQVLTKQPERMLEYFNNRQYYSSPQYHAHALPNVWLGVSVENQATADERREYLWQCPAAVKFVSYEPALGPIDWTGWEFVSQIISGGESGPGARPSHPDWHRATRDFCQENKIAYFLKQWGGWVPNEHGCGGDYHFNSKHVCLNLAGEVFDGWMEAHGEHIAILAKASKKAAGHLLDGRAWQQFPNRREK